MTAIRQVQGSAAVQGPLWSTRAHDWAEVQERMSRPLYEAVLRQTSVGAGTSLLDVGCGAGLFCELAASRGARVTGIDAAEEFVAIARRRTPAGEFRVAEMEALPHGARAFDVVTGFNSFQFAVRPAAALAEARRVARPGAPVVVATWGNPAHSELAQFLIALRPLLPPAPPDAPGPFALSAEGALDAFAREAGLTPRSVDEVECPFEYPDFATAVRGLLSAGPSVRAIQVSGEDRVRDVTARVLAPYRLSSGGYRLENSLRFMIATAS